MGRRDELLAKAEAQIINEYNASYAGMTVDGPIFRYGAKEYPINSISAEVLLGAQTSKSRSTATRIIGGGMVAGPGGMLLGGAAKKKTDTSKVYITIKLGDGSVHSIARSANEEGRLRGFSDKLESAVNRKWPIQTPYGTTLDLDPDSTRASSPDVGTLLIGGGLAVTVVLCFWRSPHSQRSRSKLSKESLTSISRVGGKKAFKQTLTENNECGIKPEITPKTTKVAGTRSDEEQNATMLGVPFGRSSFAAVLRSPIPMMSQPQMKED